ncbi:hypothetical protein HOY82DRAFT_617015 [Tuber indicum]|nr:hypothetical protein HOY82DRAFT_617015 [Tuber indicum]
MEAVWTRYPPVGIKWGDQAKGGKNGELGRVIVDLSFDQQNSYPDYYRTISPGLAGGALLDPGFFSSYSYLRFHIDNGICVAADLGVRGSMAIKTQRAEGEVRVAHPAYRSGSYTILPTDTNSNPRNRQIPIPAGHGVHRGQMPS